jgi:hypothetical protein
VLESATLRDRRELLMLERNEEEIAALRSAHGRRAELSASLARDAEGAFVA